MEKANKKEKQNALKLEKIRHSLSHLMAGAIQKLYPDAKFGIGPAIDNGFYYDIDLKRKFSPEDLPKIEELMIEEIKNGLGFKKKIIDKKIAKQLFKNQPYKLELIKELAGKTISVYQNNGFIDLCKGPHIKSTKEINSDAFKLAKVAGAYWRGDEKQPMLQRIYGLAFSSKKELDEYVSKQEEAEKRDHRKLGKELDLFVFSDLVGKGLPLYTERGSIIKRELERFIVDEEIKRGYKHVYTPELARVELYKTSGHYPYYKETMYPVMKVDEEELILRPMTCPHHFQLYASRQRSYRELPIRFAELAKQFRYEKSGELTGLIRVRQFCLADAHIICQKEEAINEIKGVLDLIDYVAATLGLKKGIDYRYRLSLGDRKDNKKYYKDDRAWKFAENVLRAVLKKRKAPFFEAEKEAAFYGPKIDIQMKNFSGAENTAFTVQYDFVMPKRFQLYYIDKNGQRKEPVVIHRSSIGAIERIIAFLLEHYAGHLPLWLAPVQSWVVPIGEKFEGYAIKTAKELTEKGIRAEAKTGKETLNQKIRSAEIQKIPYILVVGGREEENNSVNVRSKNQNLGEMKLPGIINKLRLEIEKKAV